MDVDPAVAEIEPLVIDTIGALAVASSDPAAARAFYCDVLGCAAVGSDVLPQTGAHQLVRLPSGQLLALAKADGPPDTSGTGIHQAYCTSAAGRDAIAGRLAAAGVEISRYREDRAAEQNDRFYFADPDGNRLQLTVREGANAPGGIFAIDHAAVQVPDMMWGEFFYGSVLGLGVEGRYGVRTADHAQARIWAKGEDDMAPGTRRLDKLYMAMGGQREVPRANMQIYFTAGAAVVGLYLATRHYQEPPEEQLAGAPRVGLAAPRDMLDRAAAALEAARWPFQGPIAHPASAPIAASLYFKDNGGNFLEVFTAKPD